MSMSPIAHQSLHDLFHRCQLTTLLIEVPPTFLQSISERLEQKLYVLVIFIHVPPSKPLLPPGSSP